MVLALRALSRGLAALAQAGGEGAACTSTSATSRSLQSEAASRYSPTPYARKAPSDVSATWLPKNPYVESWVHRRNKLEREFSWNLRNTVEVGYFLLGLSGAFYGFGLWTMRATDAANGYPRRDVLGGATGTGFMLPDEREWCVGRGGGRGGEEAGGARACMHAGARSWRMRGANGGLACLLLLGMGSRGPAAPPRAC